MVFDKDFEERLKIMSDGHKELKRKLDKKEICELTVGDFYKHLSDVYDVIEEKCDNGIEIPIRKLLAYFDDNLTKDIVYCSVFQSFSLSKNKGWFKVTNTFDDDCSFCVRVSDKLSDVLDNIYKIAYKNNVVFFEHLDYIINNKDYPAEIDDCDDVLMVEFIIRNAEKYDIDYCYGGAGMIIYNIYKKWWIWN